MALVSYGTACSPLSDLLSKLSLGAVLTMEMPVLRSCQWRQWPGSWLALEC